MSFLKLAETLRTNMKLYIEGNFSEAGLINLSKDQGAQKRILRFVDGEITNLDLADVAIFASAFDTEPCLLLKRANPLAAS